MKQNILFTCAGRRNYLINYFKEALNGNGNIIAVDQDVLAPALVDANIAIQVPDIYDELYISKLLEITKEYSVTAIISLNDLELPILSKNKTVFEQIGVKVIISDEKVIDIGFDKFKTFNFLKNLGIKTPKTFVSLESALKAIHDGELVFPLVLKPRWGSASIGIEFPNSIEELKLSYKLQKIKILDTIVSSISKNNIDQSILIQEKLNGKEYGLDIVNDFEGNYFGTFAREKLSMRSGETDKAISVIDSNIEKLGEKLAKALKHIGSMDCDAFLVNGTLYLLELNPRFGGGYPFSHEAGLNLAAIYIAWLKGEKNENILKYNNYKEGIIFTKCDRLLKVPNPKTNIKPQKYKLEVQSIKDEQDIINYNHILTKFKKNSPFYSVEYCNFSIFKNLCYFIFYKYNEPYILMPFYLEEINYDLHNKETKYFDAISPYGFNGPLLNQLVSDADLKLFWNEVDLWYQSNNVVTEFIRFNLNNNYLNYSGVLIPTLKNIKGKLIEFDDLWCNFKPKVRNNYRKATKSGLKSKVFIDDIDYQAISDLYAIYISSMVRNEASLHYYFSFDYFKYLIKNNSKSILLFLIYLGDKPISGELIIIDDKTMYSFLGGTIEEYFQYRPNDFLKIEAIKWGLKNNKKYFCLGGGRQNDDSLYQYKKSFFPYDEEAMYYTGRKIINSDIFNQLIKKYNISIKHSIESFKDTKEYFPIYNNPKIKK